MRAGLNLGDVDQFPKVDVTIDGADEVDASLNAIKGGGACLLREKVLAEAADTWVMVADSRKGVSRLNCSSSSSRWYTDSQILGTKWKQVSKSIFLRTVLILDSQGVPIEVVPFAWSGWHLSFANHLLRLLASYSHGFSQSEKDWKYRTEITDGKSERSV